MDAATLFGFSSVDWWGFTTALLYITIGSSIIYIFDLTPKYLEELGITVVGKIPGVERIPDFILGIVSGLLCILWAFCLFSFLTLKLYEKSPSIEDFQATYSRNLHDNEEINLWLNKISQSKVTNAYLRVVKHIPSSDSYVFVNNMRIFGSHVECMGKFQCGGDGLLPEKNEVKPKFSLNPTYWNHFLNPENGEWVINPLEKKWPIPLYESGVYIFDIYVGESGLEGCDSVMEIVFIAEDGSEIARRFEFNDKNKSIIDFYATSQLNPSYRICERIHMPINVNVSTGNNAKH